MRDNGDVDCGEALEFSMTLTYFSRDTDWSERVAMVARTAMVWFLWWEHGSSRDDDP